jgi:hypothetical protein
MRQSILVGGVLAAIAAVAVLLGAAFGLDIEHVALLGIALGAVVGLVPQGRSANRLLGFVGGFALAWVGYGLRAAALPDSAGGRAVAVVLVVLACAVVAMATRGTLPLWSTLVGVAAMVGAYEETYTAAPSQFVDQSLSAATAVLLAVALGYVVSALFTPDAEPAPSKRRHADDQDVHSIDELMTGQGR